MADKNTIQGTSRWVDGDALFSDTVNLPEVPRAIYVGVAGDLKMVDSRGNASVFKAVPIGAWPFQPSRIYSTLTTATNVTLLY